MEEGAIIPADQGYYYGEENEGGPGDRILFPLHSDQPFSLEVSALITGG